MKKISINDLYDYRFISNLNYSDNGKNLVFVLSQMDEKTNGYKSYLYLYRDNKISKLTSFGKESRYLFNNNDELYIFTSRDEEDNKRNQSLEQFTPVYKMSLNGGEAEKVFEIPLRVSGCKKIDNQRYLISASFDKNHPDYYKYSDDKKQAVNKNYLDNTDYEEFDEVPFYFNGMGYLKSQRNGLFIFNMKDKSLQKITPGIFSVSSYDILNNRIYYSGSSFDHIRPTKDEIYYYDLKSKKTVKVLRNKYSVHGLVSYDNRIITLMASNEDYGMNENPKVYSISADNKVKLFNGDDRSYGNASGSDCRYGRSRSFKVYKDRLYFLETLKDSVVLRNFDTKGSVHNVYMESGSVDDFDVYEDNIVMNIIKADSPQELYSLKDNKLDKISKFNYPAIKNKYVALPERNNVKSGKYNISGWVLYPKDYNPKKKYPAILDIHGGPKTIYGEIFYHEMQVWASNGYFVMYCNPYGSDGKGNEFMDMRGKYGTTDYKNIMDFVDNVLKTHKSIDTRRVCVTGGSYGGFMTNWIVGHTDRFKAAATQRSICNWISFIGTSDIGLYFTKDQCDSDLHNLEKLWDHSPLKYVDNVKTPLLFIHSDEDYRCPLEQGTQYFSAIRDNGIDTKMVVFHGENHELSRSGKPKHRIKRLTEITNWFDKYTR